MLIRKRSNTVGERGPRSGRFQVEGLVNGAPEVVPLYPRKFRRALIEFHEKFAEKVTDRMVVAWPVVHTAVFYARSIEPDHRGPRVGCFECGKPFDMTAYVNHILRDRPRDWTFVPFDPKAVPMKLRPLAETGRMAMVHCNDCAQLDKVQAFRKALVTLMNS